MTPLTQGLAQLAHHPLIHAFGWTLLHFLWQGTAVALMLWCVLDLVGSRSSQSRYIAACLALALMVALPTATFAHIAAAEVKARTAFGSGAILDTNITLQIAADQSIAPWPARIAATVDHALPWILLAWFAGLLVFLGRLNFGLLTARRLKTAATELPSPALVELFETLRLRLRISRAVHLLHSARVQVPTVIGWLRPVVLLPVACLAGLSPDQIEAVLCHELAHVRRHDYLVSVLQSVIETVLFYHPAVWWVSRQVRRERECCCDEVAISAGADRLAYARALSLLEEQRIAFPELALGANSGALKLRIQRILGRRDSAGSPAAALLTLGLAVAIAGSYFAAISRAQSESQTSHAALPQFASADTRDARAAYANQHFASAGKPGQDTDRGRIYIQFGPPESIETHPSGDASSSPYAIWHYPSFAQVGGNINLKFVDACRCGDYIVDVVRIMDKPQAAGSEPWTANPLVKAAFALRAPQAGTPAAPQNETDQGSIAGTIVDPMGALVPRAAVSAIESDGRASIGAQTNDSGAYSLSPLPPGRYKVQVTAPGFARVSQENIDVESGKTVSLNLKLSVGDATQNLTVTGAPLPAPPPPAADGAQPAGPHRVSSGVAQGLILFMTQPEYPPIAKAAHVQGIVVLRARISKAGDVEDLHVLSGPPELMVSAIDAVRQWKYKPYLLNGEPTPVETTININFTLAPSAEPPGPAADNAGLPVRRIGGSVTAPVLIYKVDPQFSAEAREAKISGIVLVNTIVNEHGIPENVHVVRGVGHGLDEQAVLAVRQYRFKPATENGTPVPVALNIEVDYNDHDSRQAQAAAIKPGDAVIEVTPQPPNQPAPSTGPAGPSAVMPVRLAPSVPASDSVPLEYHGAPVRKIGGSVTAPQVVYQVDPDFSSEARKQKQLDDTVLVNLLVDAKGKPQNVHVLRGVGMGLDEKAVAAVKKYKFKPATESGNPVPVEINIEVHFKKF